MSSSSAKTAFAQPIKKKTSLEDYFDFESKADRRHEFISGQIRAMAYTSPAHGRIQTNLVVQLALCVEANGCRVYGSDRMLIVPDCDQGVFYPDLVVVCGEEKFHAHKKKMLATLNPSLIIEILSNSTEETDRIDKWACYRKIKSLKQYIMVEQNQLGIHSYRRASADDRQWNYDCADKLEESVDVLDCVLRVGEVYKGVHGIYF